MKRFLWLGALLLLLLGGVRGVLGSLGYDLQDTLDGGAGRQGDSTQGYNIQGSVGQPEAGQANMTGGNYELRGGFWGPLPTVANNATPTATATLTPTATSAAGGPTSTPTITPSPTNTVTPNAVELTATAGGATLTPSNTPTVTPSPTNTATPNAVELTATVGGATLTPSHTPVISLTATSTRTPTRTVTPNPSGPKLVIYINGPKQVIPGKAAWFILTFGNYGKAVAVKTQITIILPPYTIFDAVNSTPGWVLLKTASTQAGQLAAGETYVYEPGDLAASQSGEVTFATTVQADAPTGLTLNAETSIGDSTSTGSTATAKSNTVVEVVDKIRSYLPLITR